MFRKLLDQGQAGDNVGILLRGTKREEVQRGQVLCKPGSVKPHTHFTAEIYVLSKEEGGRHTPFFNNYRPQFYFRTTDVTGAVELAKDKEMVMPGDNVSITVKLIAPIAMEEGLRFAIREGGRTVGAGVVAKILESPISEAEVLKIVSQMQEGVEKPGRRCSGKMGEMVRIKEGPFTDFNGSVEDVNYDKSKVRVAVTISVARPRSSWISPRSRKSDSAVDGRHPGVFPLFAFRVAGRGAEQVRPARRLTSKGKFMAKKIRSASSSCKFPPAEATRRRRSARRCGRAALNIMEFCKAFNAQTQGVEPGCRCRW